MRFARGAGFWLGWAVGGGSLVIYWWLGDRGEGGRVVGGFGVGGGGARGGSVVVVVVVTRGRRVLLINRSVVGIICQKDLKIPDKICGNRDTARHWALVRLCPIQAPVMSSLEISRVIADIHRTTSCEYVRKVTN